VSTKPQSVKRLRGKALQEHFKNRPVLFTDVIEFEGMSLCVVNPEIEDDPPAVKEKKRTVKAAKRKKK
jgi:hypothetical protein